MDLTKIAAHAQAILAEITKFAFRFAEARHPRIERGLAAVFVLAVALGVLVLVGLPQARGAMRLGLLLAAVAGSSTFQVVFWSAEIGKPESREVPSSRGPRH